VKSSAKKTSGDPIVSVRLPEDLVKSLFKEAHTESLRTGKNVSLSEVIRRRLMRKGVKG